MIPIFDKFYESKFGPAREGLVKVRNLPDNEAYKEFCKIVHPVTKEWFASMREWDRE